MNCAKTGIIGAVLLWLCAGMLLLAVPASFAESKINCDIQNQRCKQQVGERTVALNITPKPVKAMKELTFTVTIHGKPLQKAPHIDLDMPAMEMGPNRVTMEKVGDLTYEGTGVIVRCPSGNTLWEAIVTLPGAGKASFIFDVVY